MHIQNPKKNPRDLSLNKIEIKNNNGKKNIEEKR